MCGAWPTTKRGKKNRTERCGNSTRKDGQQEKQKRFKEKKKGGGEGSKSL
jgi:hypothetical protein